MEMYKNKKIQMKREREKMDIKTLAVDQTNKRSLHVFYSLFGCAALGKQRQ